jgi:hypothetical protein
MPLILPPRKAGGNLKSENARSPCSAGEHGLQWLSCFTVPRQTGAETVAQTAA